MVLMPTEIKTDTGRGRVAFLDLLRILAAFCVIVNHTNCQDVPLGALWASSVAWFFASKIAVPVFVMISGYLMLQKKHTYKKTAISVLRIGICLLLFSVIYYAVDCITGDVQRHSLREFLFLLRTAKVTNAFWYLYMYLGLLLMMPFVQKMAAGMEKTDYHVFFGITALFVSFWPMLIHYVPQLEYTHQFALPLFSGYICLLLAGDYMRRYVKPTKKGKYIAAAVFAAMCALNVLLTWFEYVRNPGEYYLYFDNRLFLPIMLESVCVFYLVSGLNIGEKAGTWISKLGGLTFAIYLVSDMVIDGLEPLWYRAWETGVPLWPAMLTYEVSVFLISALLALILKQIPLIKKLL